MISAAVAVDLARAYLKPRTMRGLDPEILVLWDRLGGAEGISLGAWGEITAPLWATGSRSLRRLALEVVGFRCWATSEYAEARQWQVLSCAGFSRYGGRERVSSRYKTANAAWAAVIFDISTGKMIPNSPYFYR